MDTYRDRRWGEKKRERSSVNCSTPLMLPADRTGPGRVHELHLDLSHGCQGTKCLDYHLLPPRILLAGSWLIPGI